MNDDTKPVSCYICAKRPTVEVTEDGKHNIYCSNERCPGVAIEKPEDTLSEAISNWNLINSYLKR